MLGVVIRGADRVAFMEKLCCADLKALPDGMGSLTMITNEQGGIIDDCIVTKAGDHLCTPLFTPPFPCLRLSLDTCTLNRAHRHGDQRRARGEGSATHQEIHEGGA